MLFLLKFVLTVSAVVVIILVLLQKGKGGGLAGALGGMGGQSAFGTKAGDMFTKITIGVAGFWILVCVLAAGTAKKLAGGDALNVAPTPGAGAPQNPGAPAAPSSEKPADTTTKPASSEKPATLPEPSTKPSEKPNAPAGPTK